jgi:hypothetical protein
MEIDEHVGCAMSGLIADARTLVEHARVETQVRFYNLVYFIHFSILLYFIHFSLLISLSYCMFILRTIDSHMGNQ